MAIITLEDDEAHLGVSIDETSAGRNPTGGYRSGR